MAKPYRTVANLTRVGEPFPADTEAVVVVLNRLADAIEANTAAVEHNGIVLGRLRKDVRGHIKWSKATHDGWVIRRGAEHA